MSDKKTNDQALVKATHTKRPGWDYYLVKGDQREIDRLLVPFPFQPGCVKVCTKVMTLLPKTNIQGQTGLGYFMINVDGFRYLNAYVISDPLNSTTQRGFSLELSFSVNPFVYGVGVVGETSFFFNFDTYYDPGAYMHGIIHSQTSDLTSLGGLPQIGGIDLTHVLRMPVLGPYVRASVFNEDVRAQNAEVVAYLST